MKNQDLKDRFESLSRKAAYWQNQQWCYYANLPYLIDRENRQKYANVFSGPRKNKIQRKIKSKLKEQGIKGDVLGNGLVILKTYQGENVSLSVFLNMSYEDAVATYGEEAIDKSCTETYNAVTSFKAACSQTLDYIIKEAHHG